MIPQNIITALLLLIIVPTHIFALSTPSSSSSSSVVITTKSTHQKIIRIGTRPSPLAKIQANTVANALQTILHSSNDETIIEIIEITSTGDQSQYQYQYQNQSQSQSQSQSSSMYSTSSSNSNTSISIQTQPLAVQAVDFTGTLDHALLNNEIDIAVHSLKDIPPSKRWRTGIEIASCLEREDPLDVLVVRVPVQPISSTSSSSSSSTSSSSSPDLCTTRTIQNLPRGTRVGTSSVRRQAQLLHLRNDLELVNLRGNVGSRLNALEDGTVDALLLASAGLNRLIAVATSSSSSAAASMNSTNASTCDDTTSTSTSTSTSTKRQPVFYHPNLNLCWSDIPPEELLSGACQGIVASTCRSEDRTTLNLLREIDHCDSSIAAAAERSFLDGLDSFRPALALHESQGSSEWIGRPPLAALLRREVNVKANVNTSTSTVGDEGWIFQGILARPDGSRVLKTLEKVNGVLSIKDAKTLGRDQAKKLLLEAGYDFYQL